MAVLRLVRRLPGVLAGQQSPPGHCLDLQHRVPAGAVLVRG